MLAMSFITACIPSIKRFLADIQSGLMGVNISEPYELTHSGGKYATGTQAGIYGKGTSLGSKVASRLGVTSITAGGRSANVSALRSRGEKDPNNLGSQVERGVYLDTDNYNGRDIRGRRNDVHETSESVKGLTDDVIMQTIDYKVEYEDGQGTEGSLGGRSSSGGRDDGRTHGHGPVAYDVNHGYAR
jgi:hypothetical protein